VAVQGDLLTPTLGGHRPRDWRTRLPWRVQSQFYVAFLGGPVAVTLVAALNAVRLRMRRATVALFVGAGLLATGAGFAAAAALSGETAPRLVLQLAGVLVYGVFYLLQRTPDRVHSMFSPHDDEDRHYASLWGPGLAAVIAGWIAQLCLYAVLLEGV
jgi:hypothetical protein